MYNRVRKIFIKPPNPVDEESESETEQPDTTDIPPDTTEDVPELENEKFAAQRQQKGQGLNK